MVTYCQGMATGEKNTSDTPSLPVVCTSIAQGTHHIIHAAALELENSAFKFTDSFSLDFHPKSKGISIVISIHNVFTRQVFLL